MAETLKTWANGFKAKRKLNPAAPLGMEKKMIRFIFLCMAVVALSILTVSAQFMVNSIEESRNAVTARNTITAPAAETAAAESVTFEQIYAMTPAPAPAQFAEGEMDPSMLNDIETAAGGDDFGTGFTGVAPAALSDDEPVTPAITTDALQSAN